MKIQFVKSTCGIGYAYLEGAKLDSSKAIGKEFIELGYAIELSDDEASDLPDDLPMRKQIVDAGITTLEALKEIATPEALEALKGIGEKSAKAIIDYLETL